MLPETIESAERRATVEQIAQYYNANTARFLKLGGSGATAAIHRAIWAPGVSNKSQAFNYLNALVARSIQPLFVKTDKPFRILDLGCGVGGTATWLAQALAGLAGDESSPSTSKGKVQVTGVTISAAQLHIARQRAEELGLGDSVNFLLGDFAAMPAVEPVHAACAIESFVHAQNAESFFAMAYKQILPGGRLIICDDFLSATERSDLSSSRAERWIARFKKGWHLNNLLTVPAVITAAEEAGFTLLETHDLSGYLRSFPPALLWLVTTATRLPLRNAYWQNLSGGTALQVCVRQSWTQYQALVWEKRP